MEKEREVENRLVDLSSLCQFVFPVSFEKNETVHFSFPRKLESSAFVYIWQLTCCIVGLNSYFSYNYLFVHVNLFQFSQRCLSIKNFNLDIHMANELLYNVRRISLISGIFLHYLSDVLLFLSPHCTLALVFTGYF